MINNDFCYAQYENWKVLKLLISMPAKLNKALLTR